MSEVSVIVIVDTQGALSSNDLGSNVYMVDTHKHVGSGNEGQDELQTACQENQVLNWRVEAVSPDGDVAITGFTGAMVDQKWCQPAPQGISQNQFWSGTVQSQGGTGTVQYSIVLDLGGKEMTFDPFLIVSD